MIDFSYRGWLGSVAPPGPALESALGRLIRPATAGEPLTSIELDPLVPAWVGEAVHRFAAREGLSVRPAIRVGGRVVGRGEGLVCSSPDLAGRVASQDPGVGSVCVVHRSSTLGDLLGVEVVEAGGSRRDATLHPVDVLAWSGLDSDGAGEGAGARLAKRLRQIPGVRLRRSRHPAWCVVDVRRPVSPLLPALHDAGVHPGEVLEGPGYGGVLAAIVPSATPDEDLAQYVAALAAVLAR